AVEEREGRQKAPPGSIGRMPMKDELVNSVRK
nr:hypothetical protein [Tanacetum cinerariifolium]